MRTYKGNPKGSTSFSVAMVLLYYILYYHAREKRAYTEHTSGQGLFQWRQSDITAGHFRSKRPNRADIAQLLVAHARTQVNTCTAGHPREHPLGSRDLRSLRVAMVLVLLYYILYYYYCSSTKCTSCACDVNSGYGEAFSGHVVYVTSGPMTSLPVKRFH